MAILWEHMGVGPAYNRPAYSLDEGQEGLVAVWRNQAFAFWDGSADSGIVAPPWSPPDTPAHWKEVVEDLIKEKWSENGKRKDAIVCFAWEGKSLRIAVARVDLPESVGASEPPSWFVTGKVPRGEMLTLEPADVQLLVHGRPSPVVWQIVAPEGLKATYVWAKLGVAGTLPTPIPFGVTPSMATGRIWPLEVASPIEVQERIVGIRDGMAVRPGPAGFKLDQLIVQTADGTCRSTFLWVGDQLTLAKA